MKERNSTFELLRIIAIIFIMIHHVVVFGLGVVIMTHLLIVKELILG